LYRITYNCAVDYLRKNKGAIDLEVNDLDERLEQDISNRELVELVLRSLEAELRVVVILFYLEEQSLKDISLALEIPEGTVKSRLNTARQRMNDLLVKKGAKL
jgi:RNA polymerase sigma-70 factor (ECF subfamily)